MSNEAPDTAEKLRDTGERPTSQDEDEEVETEISVEQDRKAPMVSVKIERKINLGDYNNATAQVFAASGTLDNQRQLLDEDGEVNDEALDAIEESAQQLASKARDKVIQALRQQEKIDVQVSQ